MIGVLGVGWLSLVVPVATQEAAQVAPAASTAPVETTTAIATETSAETNVASTDTTAPAATDAPTEQVATASVPPSATEPQPATTNISILGFNGLPAAANAPPPDPRAGDAPGWWFEAALKQVGEYPAFLGVRFAEASRAVIIETPNRKLTTGQPLIYRLWVCNDLPQPMECRVEHAVRKGEIVVSHTNVWNFIIEGSQAQAVDRFQQSTDKLAPGTYTIDATLRDQDGKLLHHMTETVELTPTKLARP